MQPVSLRTACVLQHGMPAQTGKHMGCCRAHMACSMRALAAALSTQRLATAPTYGISQDEAKLLMGVAEVWYLDCLPEGSAGFLHGRLHRQQATMSGRQQLEEQSSLAVDIFEQHALLENSLLHRRPLRALKSQPPA